MPDKIFSFIKIFFLSYAQVFFSQKVLCGVLLCVATFINPLAATVGVVCCLLANCLAFLFFNDELTSTGLFGTQGLLIGLTIFIFYKLNIVIGVFLILAIVMGNLIFILLYQIFKKVNIPALSLSFVLVSWMFLIVLKSFPIEKNNLLVNIFIFKKIESLMVTFFPNFLLHYFKSLSACFFQNSILIGLIFFIALLYNSRIQTLFSFLGFLITLIFYLIFNVKSPTLQTSLFNNILISMALGGFFIVFNISNIFLVILANLIAVFFNIFLFEFFKTFNLPVLAFTFNLTTLLFLYFINNKLINEKIKLTAVPFINLSFAEQHLKNYLLELKQKNKVLNLILPFFGRWMVSQGNNSLPTHQPPLQYAWDFVVVDNNLNSFKSTGTKLENYFCFNLPVLAPEEGEVVKIINFVEDNEPPATNPISNWGNLIIIKHSENLFSELSHFKQFSLTVKEGDKINKGQIIGYCGNSGQSREPHIHYQLQEYGLPAGNTLATKFINYININEKDEEELILEGAPLEKEIIKNYAEDYAFNFLNYFPLEDDKEFTYNLSINNKIIVKDKWIFEKNKIIVKGKKEITYNFKKEDNFILFNHSNFYLRNTFDYFLAGLFIVPIYFNELLYFNSKKFTLRKTLKTYHLKAKNKIEILNDKNLKITCQMINQKNKEIFYKETFFEQGKGLTKLLFKGKGENILIEVLG